MRPNRLPRWMYALLLALALGTIVWGVSLAEDPEPEIVDGVTVVHPGGNTEGAGPMAPRGEAVAQDTSGMATFVRRYAGLTFVPRDSDQTHDYGNAGCIQGKTNGSGLWVHSLDLPQGSQITNFTLYFYDTDGAGSVSGWITSFDNQGATSDLVNVSSTGTGGHGSASVPVNIVVDNDARSYVIYGRPGSNGSTTRFCGAAVTYSVDLNSLRIPILYGDN